MKGSCSIAKFWIIILMIFFSNFSLTKSAAIEYFFEASFSDDIEYFLESPLFDNKGISSVLSSGMSRFVEEILDDYSSLISGTREVNVDIEPTAQEYTDDYFMKISNFLLSLSCPKNLMNSLELTILLSQNLANCTSDLSPEIILKIMLIMLFDDAYRYINAGADKYLEIFSLVSFSDAGSLDNVVALMKMNVLAMFKIPVSKRTFSRIFVPFIKTFSEKLPGGRLDLSMIWVLEIAANEYFDMNISDKIFKLNHMMEFIEAEVIPQFGIFFTGMLSQKSLITCTSFRIEYYLEIENLAMVHSILSDGTNPISGGDLVYISKLAISKKCADVFKILFENSDRNLDYSLLLSSNSILSLSEAKNVLQLYLPKITQIYLNPELFVNCDNIWQILIDIFYAKATMEEIMEYFLNHNMYYLLAKCFEYTVPEGLLADDNDIVSKFMEEDSKSFCKRLLRNILEFIDIKGCPRLKRLLTNLIPDPEELNSLILEVISDYNFSKLTHDKFPILIQISGDLVYLFDLAVHLKNHSALSKICLCFRIESDGELIAYKEYSQRSVHISDHQIHIFDDSGDIYDILI